MKVCQICGCDYESISNKSMYCGDDCRDYNKFKNALERILIDLKPCNKNARLIKGDIFRMANIIRIGTNRKQGVQNES